MHKTGIVFCCAIIAVCTACTSDAIVRSGVLHSANKVPLSAERGQLADVASRITLALDEACGCRPASNVESSSPRVCGYPIKIDNMSELEASTNGRRIRITSGMLRFFAHDDELAFVLAHELSHILLGHAGAFSGLSPTSAEAEADQLGIRIVSDAHFDTKIAAKFPERLARSYPGMNSRYGAYGMPAQRTALISSAFGEGSRQQAYADLRGSCNG